MRLKAFVLTSETRGETSNIFTLVSQLEMLCHVIININIRVRRKEGRRDSTLLTHRQALACAGALQAFIHLKAVTWKPAALCLSVTLAATGYQAWLLGENLHTKRGKNLITC